MPDVFKNERFQRRFMKVFELAKEFKVESKIVLNLLNQMGKKVANHMSKIEDDDCIKLRKILSEKATQNKEMKSVTKKTTNQNQNQMQDKPVKTNQSEQTMTQKNNNRNRNNRGRNYDYARDQQRAQNQKAPASVEFRLRSTTAPNKEPVQQETKPAAPVQTKSQPIQKDAEKIVKEQPKTEAIPAKPAAPSAPEKSSRPLSLFERNLLRMKEEREARLRAKEQEAAEAKTKAQSAQAAQTNQPASEQKNNRTDNHFSRNKPNGKPNQNQTDKPSFKRDDDNHSQRNRNFRADNILDKKDDYDDNLLNVVHTRKLPKIDKLDRDGIIQAQTRERERDRDRGREKTREREKDRERGEKISAKHSRESREKNKKQLSLNEMTMPKMNRKAKKHQPEAPAKVEIARPKHIKIGETIIVKDLASKMSYTAAEIMKKLLMMGVMATINQEIDFDTASLVAAEFDVTVEALPQEKDMTEVPEIEDPPESLVPRPPVVTVMGHVDHGKTSLLDAIRQTSVTSGEAGGITQRIGAYQVNCKGKKIVFLDTPGHEAFTAMRARGAQVTDIAVLVVAADDGVMPQTVEAIHHAQAAKVPIIVAINKMDKPGANPDRVKKELMDHELVCEEWGGQTIMVEVSAKKQTGIDDLLEMILLVAEVQELKANPNREARGVIIEAQLDKGRGPVTTVLVQNGTLRVGDSILAGTTYGKVRAMLNDLGEPVKKAPPSMPVEVLGLSDVPAAGDQLAVVDEKLARSIAQKRIEKQRSELIQTKKVSLDDLFSQIQAGQLKDLNIVIKADVQGSVEALKGSLLALNKNNEVRVVVVHAGVGAVNESDVTLASAANAIIIAFNVRPDANAKKMADSEKVDIRLYQVIYDALNDVKDAMSGLLAPKFKEIIQGKVEIRQVMKFSKVLVAGSYVLEGKISNHSKVRIVRDNIVVFDGEVDSLRRFKDDVKEVTAGYECGLTLKDYRDFREGDILEVYTLEEVATSIENVNEASTPEK